MTGSRESRAEQTHIDHTVEIALGPQGKADVEVLSGDVTATARELFGSVVVTFQGKPNEPVTLAIRGSAANDSDRGGDR